MKLAMLPRLGETLFTCILLAGLLVGQRMLNQDSDIGRHLTLGRYMLDSGRIPTRDTLSFTHAGEARPPYEWLSQVVLALAERAIGLDGVVLLTSALIAAAFLVIFSDALERGGAILVSLSLAILAAAASSLHWLTRPHIFTFLFLAIWLRLLDRLRRGHPGAVWQLPVVMLVWANLHGGFIFGFVTWLAYAAGWMIDTRRPGATRTGGPQLLLVGGASLLASTLTPALGANWYAVLRNSNPYVLSVTAETLPVTLAAPGTWPFIGLVFMGLILGIRQGGRLVPQHILLLVGTAGLGLLIMRNIPLFCIAAVPILAAWAKKAWRASPGFESLQERIAAIDSSRSGYLGTFIAIVLVGSLLALGGTSAHASLYAFDSQRFPVAAMDWAAEHGVADRPFNDINWGGYILYRAYPDTRVFIDSQSDFYGAQFMGDYSTLYTSTGDWPGAFDRYGVDSAILAPGAPLAIRLTHAPEWKIAFQDSTAVVFVRRGP